MLRTIEDRSLNIVGRNAENELIYEVRTPAFLLDKDKLARSIRRVHRVKSEATVRLLYPLKAMSSFSVLIGLQNYIDGYAVSSLFEARLANEIAQEKHSIHFTSPSIALEQFCRIQSFVDFISFNSLTQLETFNEIDTGKTSFGLRANPQISFIDDLRYDPARTASKLGVPLNDLVALLSNGSQDTLVGITGIHFHNNTDSTDFDQLLQTVERLDWALGDWLSTLDWINLGGGYLFPQDANLEPFYKTVDLLKSKHRLEVFIEPGAAIVRDAGFMVSSVVDIFKSDGKHIAVLDTTVNHMPEVFEYQYEPDVMGHVESGKHEYILAGGSCLAGDVFGEYAFDEPLEVGSRVVFTGMGAYTLVKAHMFNGINLPTIYSLRENGELVLEKEFTYEDFVSRCGGNTHDFA